MNKMIYPMMLLVFAGILLLPMEGNAQMGPGMMGPGYGYGMGPGMGYGPGYGGGYCPYCGRPMGPGMMGPGYGYGMMGPGMMGPGYGMGPGMMGPGYGPQYQQPQKPLEEKDIKSMLENYLQSTRNPNLKLGKITDKGPYFEADIVTKNEALVDKILVDKNTGWMRSAY